MQMLSRFSCWAAGLLVRFYRTALSPLKPRCCRFTPSCSCYAQTAFSRFGFFRACGLTLWRILRCHPFYRGCLYDPVPELRRGYCQKFYDKNENGNRLTRAGDENG